MNATPPGLRRHEYDTLSTPLPIRFLTLFPADSFEAPLKYKLETSDLLSILQSGLYDKTSEETGRPCDGSKTESHPLAFEALSYTWGSPGYTANISFDDATSLPITANLEAFLRYRRELTRPIRLWIDAVCINQDDLAERNAQVRNMSMLYAVAPRLTIWLGPPGNKSDAAMRELRNLAMEHPFAKLDPMDREVFTAIEDLLTREWWERVWIIQELRFGATYSKRGKVRVVCGQQDIEWLSLVLACARLKLSGKDWRRGSKAVDNALLLDTQAQAYFISTKASLEEHRADGITQLLRNVVEFRHFRATNPRDKIFALSGMMISEHHPGPIFPVMYEASVEQTYIVFAAMVMDCTKDLNMLSHCQKPPHVTSVSTTLPSWVPNWSSPTHTRPLPLRQVRKQETLPWWSLPDRDGPEEGPIRYRFARQNVLRKIGQDVLKARTTWKVGALPSWVADTLP